MSVFSLEKLACIDNVICRFFTIENDFTEYLKFHDWRRVASKYRGVVTG